MALSHSAANFVKSMKSARYPLPGRGGEEKGRLCGKQGIWYQVKNPPEALMKLEDKISGKKPNLLLCSKKKKETPKNKTKQHLL